MTGDFNADGNTDFLFISQSTLKVFLSNGDGTFAGPTTTAPSGGSLGEPSGGCWYPMTGDFGGDGKTDFLFIDQSALWVFQANGPAGDLVPSITSGLGATTSLTYLPLTKSSVYTKDGDATYPLQDIQVPIYVVSRLDAPNGLGGLYSSTYSYAGAKGDVSGRGFLGFRQMTTTDLQTSLVRTTNYLVSFPSLGLTAFPCIGLTASQTKILSSAVPPLTLNQTTNSYSYTNASNATQSCGTGGGATVTTPSNTGAPYRVAVSQSVAASSDLDRTVIPPATTTYLYDAYGNPTQVVASTPDGFSKTTTNTYTNDVTHWFLGRLTNATVTSTTP